MKNITQAIINVIKSVKGIEKKLTVGEGRNSYKGVSDLDVKNVLGKAMADNGLCILPISIDPTIRIERWETQYNGQPQVKQQVFTEVKTKYILLHSESGECIEIEGYGHGVDSQDKSAGKATTYALKYALLYSFLVPTGEIDDTDKEHSDSHQTPPKPTVTTAKPALKPGSDAWFKAVDWLAQQGSVSENIERITKRYALSESDAQILAQEAMALTMKHVDPEELAVDDAIRAIVEADDQRILQKIWDECSALHSNQRFTDAFMARKKTLAKLKAA